MKRIAIIPNNGKDLGLLNTKKIIEYLADRAELYMDTAYSVIGMKVNYVTLSELYSKAEVLLVLGGDGTILQCAAESAKKHIPILGINLGRIGFMTEVEIDDIECALDKLLEDDYTTEKRMMMRVEIKKDNKLHSCCHALNDVVVSKSAGMRLIGMELYTDGQLVNRYIADGLIIATPTGSTGYSISAGGPVVDPRMQLYVATPICAHMLSVRSAVLPSEKKIVIKLDKTYPECDAIVSADGDVQGYIKDIDEVIITKSEYEFELIKIGNQSFYDTVLRKLS
ncbi:MAG: NAD(+)/NADH kinase [Clostridia bacterium]|nr:NAD(+)/NADH kinase [Clostridia bacterium]